MKARPERPMKLCCPKRVPTPLRQPCGAAVACSRGPTGMTNPARYGGGLACLKRKADGTVQSTNGTAINDPRCRRLCHLPRADRSEPAARWLPDADGGERRAGPAHRPPRTAGPVKGMISDAEAKPLALHEGLKVLEFWLPRSGSLLGQPRRDSGLFTSSKVTGHSLATLDFSLRMHQNA